MDPKVKKAAQLLGKLVKPAKVGKADDDKLRHISEVKKQAEKYRRFFKEGFAGKAGTRKPDVDAKQLAMGIKVEMEHTDDEAVSLKIALDHLTEIPDYYTRLKKLEAEAEAEGMKKA